VKFDQGKGPSFILSRKDKRSTEFCVAMYDDVVHLSIRGSQSARVDERNSVWRLRGISTKESFKKDTHYGSHLDLCIHMHRPCGVGHHRSDRLCLDRAKETAGSSTTVSIFR
jgi:hypothetical protein